MRKAWWRLKGWSAAVLTGLLLCGPALAGGSQRAPFGIGGLADSRHRRLSGGQDLTTVFGCPTTPDDVLAACLLAIAAIAIVWVIIKDRPAPAGRS